MRHDSFAREHRELVPRSEAGIETVIEEHHIAFAEGHFATPGLARSIGPGRVLAMYAVHARAQFFQRWQWLAGAVQYHVCRVEVDE